MKKGKQRRIFSFELKLDLVKKLNRGDLRGLDVTKTYGVSTTAVYKWLRKYSDLYDRDYSYRGTKKYEQKE